jgi:low temperature requirement protein LtrA
MQLHVLMTGRDPEQTHRAATPLELFFDLTFVVAVAQAGEGLHHGLVEGHAGDVLPVFPLAFFGIWWAWMNFTWFASAYDTDDAVYRLAVLVQLTGVLVVAAGVPRALNDHDFGVATLGYVIMRLALVGQWLRAAASHPGGRRCALRYAGGIAAAQAGWVARLALPDGAGLAAFVVLMAAEMAIPYWAESAGRTPWHPGHIAERYGLFTLIVLGESVLSATVAVQVALDSTSTFGELAPVIVGGILTVFFMWWLYFDMPAEQVVGRARAAFTERPSGPFLWGYGHYFLFASAAAAGAGLAVAVDQATHHSKLTDTQAGFAITVPVTIYLVAVWAIHYTTKAPGPMRTYAVPIAAVLILASSFTPEPVLVTGLLLASLVAAAVIARCFQPAPGQRGDSGSARSTMAAASMPDGKSP